MNGQPDDLSRRREARGSTGARRSDPARRDPELPPRGNRGVASRALLTIAEVLAELQVARSTFDTWRNLGSAPECIKLPNGQLRVRRRALEAWLTSHVEIDAS